MNKPLPIMKQAIAIIDQLREGLAALPRESRRQFIERFQIIYRGHVETAYRLQQSLGTNRVQLRDISFSMAQWSAMTSTAGALAQMAARFQAGDDALAALIRKRQDLARRVHGLNKRLVFLLAQPGKQRKAKTKHNLRELLNTHKKHLKRVDERLKAKFPDYFKLANPHPLEIEQLRTLLQKDEALLFFLDTPKTWATSGRSYLWLVSKQDGAFIRIEQGRKALAKAVRELRFGLDASTGKKRGLTINKTSTSRQGLPFNLGKSHALYQQLFGQIEKWTRDKKTSDHSAFWPFDGPALSGADHPKADLASTRLRRLWQSRLVDQRACFDYLALCRLAAGLARIFPQKKTGFTALYGVWQSPIAWPRQE